MLFNLASHAGTASRRLRRRLGQVTWPGRRAIARQRWSAQVGKRSEDMTAILVVENG